MSDEATHYSCRDARVKRKVRAGWGVRLGVEFVLTVSLCNFGSPIPPTAMKGTEANVNDRGGHNISERSTT